jgi:hypothetical protein
MKLKELESKYNYKFSELFKKLWNDGMLDWMGGRTAPFDANESWEKSVYPQLKEHPPLLLHTGGFDFEMLQAEEILNFMFDEFWNIETHTFIPFAKTEEGAIFAFYDNIKTEGESAVVCIWNDMNETEVLAKNFEDFILRKMLEALYDIDKDELDADYKESGFEGYRSDILRDLKSISPYMNDVYSTLLEEMYNREEVSESMISYSLISREELAEAIQTHLAFEELNTVFEHEIS